MRKRTLALPLAVLLVLLVFPSWTAPDKPPQSVEVTNFPQSQNVNGVVRTIAPVAKYNAELVVYRLALAGRTPPRKGGACR